MQHKKKKITTLKLIWPRFKTFKALKINRFMIYFWVQIFILYILYLLLAFISIFVINFIRYMFFLNDQIFILKFVYYNILFVIN